MSDALLIAVLGRLHSKSCFLVELEDLAAPAQRASRDWVRNFVAHPLTTLIRWGLVDAYDGLTPLTADEVEHISLDDRVWEVQFKMSSTSQAIEQALGRDIWSVTKSKSME